MRVIGRNDPVLFAGLTLALLVVFQRPIQRLLDVAREVEQTYGVALMPALLILTVMFVFHQYAKRREMKADASAAALEAVLARARAEEMEQLMRFGQALARSLSTEAVREAVLQHLPTLAAGADAWVVLRTETGWERLTDCACSRWPAESIERIGDRAASMPLAEQERPDGIDCDGHVCFVMLAGSRPIGVLALPPGAPVQNARQTMGAAAALLTIAVRNAQLFADVRDHSVKDSLTGCFNRAHTFEILDSELVRSQRAGTPLSVILFDVDRFKTINDRHGHLCGDMLLAAVGQRMRQALRRSDIRCRYGGDEFLVVLPETSASGAARGAEWLRGELEQIRLLPAGQPISVTISAGVATAMAGECTSTELVDRADQALYRGKAAGRNCVRLADEPFGPMPEFDLAAQLTAH